METSIPPAKPQSDALRESLLAGRMAETTLQDIRLDDRAQEICDPTASLTRSAERKSARRAGGSSPVRRTGRSRSAPFRCMARADIHSRLIKGEHAGR